MAAKIFEVGDVLPATTQLKIYSSMSFKLPAGIAELYIKSDSNTFNLLEINYNPYGTSYYRLNGSSIDPFELESGFIIDTSSWSIEKRTITTVSVFLTGGSFAIMCWQDLNAPTGYTITFNSNGGTTISDIEEATELPTPLPTPTRSGYTFVAWYYESNFQTRAKAGDTIESNVTLYAKWHNLGSLFTEIADAIRSKDGTSETIRDVDFGERVKQIQGAKEEETKTVTPDFSSGNQVITPTSGKVMTQVTINKDTNLIADNIKKDVTVHGITGTLESGGGSGGYDLEIRGDYGSIIVYVKDVNNTTNYYEVRSSDTTHYLKNITWVKLVAYGPVLDIGGLTESQAVSGHTLTQNSYIYTSHD